MEDASWAHTQFPGESVGVGCLTRPGDARHRCLMNGHEGVVEVKSEQGVINSLWNLLDSRKVKEKTLKKGKNIENIDALQL